MSANAIVIDASAALKWRLRDEEATEQADALLDDFLAGKFQLLTVTLFDYEIANALKVAASMRRLNQDEASGALADFQQYRIARCDFRELEHLAFQLACQHQRSVYDSAYLALAQSKQVWFFTGDRRLFNAVQNALSWVKWIGDYRLDLIADASQ